MPGGREDPPKLSVVIPSLNQGRYIEECLQSILDQGYDDTQIIVIDGGSTDSTRKVLERYDDRIAYWEYTADRGQSHALNKGFARAEGDIYAWQNADDFYLPGAFASVLEVFEQQDDTPLIFGDWIEVDEVGNELVRWYAFDFSARSARYGGTSAIAQAMFWRADVHQRFGLFPEQLHQVMDHYFTFKVGMNEGYDRFLRLDAPLTAFRRHRGQKTGNLQAERVASEVAEMRSLLDLPSNSRAVDRIWTLAYRVARTARYWRRGGTRYLLDRVREAAALEQGTP